MTLHMEVDRAGSQHFIDRCNCEAESAPQYFYSVRPDGDFVQFIGEILTYSDVVVGSEFIRGDVSVRVHEILEVGNLYDKQESD